MTLASRDDLDLVRFDAPHRLSLQQLVEEGGLATTRLLWWRHMAIARRHRAPLGSGPFYAFDGCGASRATRRSHDTR